MQSIYKVGEPKKISIYKVGEPKVTKVGKKMSIYKVGEPRKCKTTLINPNFVQGQNYVKFSPDPDRN